MRSTKARFKNTTHFLMSPSTAAGPELRESSSPIPKHTLQGCGGTNNSSLFQSRGTTLHRESTHMVGTFALFNSHDSAIHQHSNAWKISGNRRQKECELEARSFRWHLGRRHKSAVFTNVHRASFPGALSTSLVHPVVNHASLDGKSNGLPGFLRQIPSSVTSASPCSSWRAAPHRSRSSRLRKKPNVLQN
jgi:hypothetical protein